MSIQNNENQLSYRQITELEDTYDLPRISYGEINNGILLKDVSDGFYEIEYCFDGWKNCGLTVAESVIKYVEFYDYFGGSKKYTFNEIDSFYQGFIFGKLISKILKRRKAK